MGTLVGTMIAGSDRIELEDGGVFVAPVSREALRLAWLRLPPELGGERRAVRAQSEAPCPCGVLHTVPRFDLDGPEDVFVFECDRNGWLWCRNAND